MNQTCGLRIQDRFSKLAEIAFIANLVSLFLKRTDLNIFCVSEIWLKDEEMQFHHSIEQFKDVTSFSRQHAKMVLSQSTNERMRRQKPSTLTISPENLIWN